MGSINILVAIAVACAVFHLNVVQLSAEEPPGSHKNRGFIIKKDLPGHSGSTAKTETEANPNSRPTAPPIFANASEEQEYGDKIFSEWTKRRAAQIDAIKELERIKSKLPGAMNFPDVDRDLMDALTTERVHLESQAPEIKRLESEKDKSSSIKVIAQYALKTEQTELARIYLKALIMESLLALKEGKSLSEEQLHKAAMARAIEDYKKEGLPKSLINDPKVIQIAVEGRGVKELIENFIEHKLPKSVKIGLTDEERNDLWFQNSEGLFNYIKDFLVTANAAEYAKLKFAPHGDGVPRVEQAAEPIEKFAVDPKKAGAAHVGGRGEAPVAEATVPAKEEAKVGTSPRKDILNQEDTDIVVQAYSKSMYRSWAKQRQLVIEKLKPIVDSLLGLNDERVPFLYPDVQRALISEYRRLTGPEAKEFEEIGRMKDKREQVNLMASRLVNLGMIDIFAEYGAEITRFNVAKAREILDPNKPKDVAVSSIEVARMKELNLAMLKTADQMVGKSYTPQARENWIFKRKGLLAHLPFENRAALETTLKNLFPEDDSKAFPERVTYFQTFAKQLIERNAQWNSPGNGNSEPKK